MKMANEFLEAELFYVAVSASANVHSVQRTMAEWIEGLMKCSFGWERIWKRLLESMWLRNCNCSIVSSKYNNCRVDKIDEKIEQIGSRRVSGASGIFRFERHFLFCYIQIKLTISFSRLTPLSPSDLDEKNSCQTERDADVPEILITQATPGKSKPQKDSVELLRANATMETVTTQKSIQIPAEMSVIDSGRFRVQDSFANGSPPGSHSSPFGSLDSLLDEAEGVLSGSRIFESGMNGHDFDLMKRSKTCNISLRFAL